MSDYSQATNADISAIIHDESNASYMKDTCAAELMQEASMRLFKLTDKIIKYESALKQFKKAHLYFSTMRGVEKYAKETLK